MAEMDTSGKALNADPGLEKILERLDADLEILERHSDDVAVVECAIQEEMRKWDREFKNTSLHSIPKHLKHLR